MPVYIDLTSFMGVSFMTGIQRVVWEVVIRLLKTHNGVILLSYDETSHEFKRISNSTFINYYENNKGSKKDIITNQVVEIESLPVGSIFFDIDSTWNNKVKRSYLLPILKEQGVKIVVHIYDIIPVLYPQYCHQDTIYRFLDYIGAYIQYADHIITNTYSTYEDLKMISEQIGIECPETTVVPLGSDFKKNENKAGQIDEKVIDIVNKGKYVLQVGTIEPRKNHKLVLDAFDKKIRDLGINVIFVGRKGWNVEDLVERIENHPELGKTLFHLQGCNDVTVDYLYKHAFLSVFPTYYEGFGLPIIESFERGIPVVSSDCKVLKEVGGEYCDYFGVENVDELIKVIKFYNDNPAEYEAKKELIKGYKSVQWEQATEKISNTLRNLSNEDKLEIKKPKQVVILSAQVDELLDTLPFIERFMKFIEEIIILCPNRIYLQLKERYNGKLKIKFLTDEELMQGRELPKDHQARNFLLRCMAIRHELIDDVFIMSDDDYRPLVPIDVNVFCEYGKYIAYYCYDLKEWSGSSEELTSYDKGMRKTLEVLLEKGLPTKQYSSHMPQIIDKRIYLELLNEYTGIEYSNVDEWSIYFNYAMNKYPYLFELSIYKTLCWPAIPSDWEAMEYPKQYLFENYYPHLYEKENIFCGFSTKYHEDILLENIQKIKVRDLLNQDYEVKKKALEILNKIYEEEKGQKGEFSFTGDENSLTIQLPECFWGVSDHCIKVSTNIYLQTNKNIDLVINYLFKTEDGIVLQEGKLMELDKIYIDNKEGVKLPIWTPVNKGKCLLSISYTLCGDKKGEVVIPAYIY